MVVSNRPEGGYRNINELLPIIEQYVYSWKDRKGGWSYVGAAMVGLPDESRPAINETDVNRVINDFLSLASINTKRDVALLPVKPADPVPMANDPMIDRQSFFERDQNRQRLLTPIFKLEASPVNVNQASESLLTALFYSVRKVHLRLWSHEEIGSRLEATKDVKYISAYDIIKPHLSENNFPSAFNYQNSVGLDVQDGAGLPGEPLFSMTES